MIGGGGSKCARADHGIGISETNAASFVEVGGSETEYDFGYDGITNRAPSQSYSLNLWIQLKNIEMKDVAYFLSPYYPSLIVKREIGVKGLRINKRPQKEVDKIENTCILNMAKVEREELEILKIIGKEIENINKLLTDQ
ncbi:hypothetical protein pdam_00020915 [Pocillopora damicornis]|uniref:Uncharacterized protein n=1 Tax=Pocillopora damicornis TaxID=46731 RepID=A0A3M6UQ80_POCDA|nr:hypothetical protein pdam_00020915 [Pocillopora damicornis]